MATLYESQTSGYAGNTYFYGATWAAMTFTPLVSHVVKYFSLYIYRTGNPGDVTVSIRATDGDSKPTGADLDSVTVPYTYLGESAAWLDFNLNVGNVIANAGTMYAIVVRSSGGSISNRLYWPRTSSSLYPRGCNAISVNSGSTWGLNTILDNLFKDYGDPLAPTVTTQAATEIKGTSATGNGNITSIGAASVTAHGVCWNKTGTPTIADDHTDEGAAGVGAFTSAMTSLDTGDLYYYRAYATNSYGTSYGSEETFTPDYTSPALTTNAATDEAVNTATLHGTLDDDGGGNCNCGFEYGKTILYGSTTPTQSKSTGQTFEQAISGLDADTTYHFRAVATNPGYTSYGSDRTFTTLGTPPEVTTNEASGIGQTGARLNGVIDNDGGLTCTVYFEYGLTTAYGSTSDTESGKVTGDTFNQLLYGLQPGKEYHFRAVAESSLGTGYGLDRTFHMAALSADAMKAHNRSYPTGRSET